MPSFQELLILILIIAVLNLTGLWPAIERGLRELRGEHDDTPPPPSAPREGLDMCYKMLGVSPSTPWEEIEKAYRQKAKIHHPDHGGDKDTMQALNDAYALIKKLRAR